MDHAAPDAAADLAPPAGARPDFLCIGTLKCGTTWLFHNLRHHPRVWIPPVKELNYFALRYPPPHWHLANNLARLRGIAAAVPSSGAEAPGPRRQRDLACLGDLGVEPFDDTWYRRLFAHRRAREIAGDISPHYALLPEAGIRHALALNPALKAIALLREPAERALSHMAMHLGPAADEEGLRRLLEGPHWPLYASHSDYAAWLGRWRALLPEGGLHLETLAGIEAEPLLVLRRICRFLGIPGRPELFPAARRRINAGRAELAVFATLLPEIRARLAPAYAALEREWPRLAAGFTRTS